MTRRILRFEAFRLDISAYELRRAGRRVKLQRIPMELLILLAEHPGVVVTREQISSRLWPDYLIAGNEQNTNTAIRKLRQALGDDAERPRYIETVIGKGYRFIAHVSEEAPEPEIMQAAEPAVPVPVSETPAAPDVAASTEGAGATKTRSWNRAAAFLASLCLAAATVMVSGIWPSDPHAPGPKVLPLTALAGDESEPALSGDGSRVAFVWTAPGAESAKIYMLNTDSVQPSPLTSGAGRDSSPGWSPDDRQIAFLREQEGRYALFLVSSNGGTERRIAELTVRDVRRLSWAPDGQSIAVRDAESAEAIPGIFLVSVATGSKRRLTKANVYGSGDWAPAYSPDGRALVFHRNAGASRSTLLYSVDVSRDGAFRGQPIRIKIDVADLTSHTAWSAGGASLISSRKSGLFRISKAGGKVEALPFADASEPTTSRSGGKLAFTHALADTDIYRIDLQTGEVKKIISSTRRDDQAYLSADGRRVAFISARSGADTLWVADSDGSRAVPLFTFGGPSIGTPHWSPDGEEIAFDSLQERSSHIYVIRSSGGAPRRITFGDWPCVRPSWSGDGKWIYFGSARSGRWEIWKVNSTGGEPVQVTRDGGREASEDPAGRFLYYTKARPDPGLWRIAISGGQPELVDDVEIQGRWSVSSRGVYYLTRDGRLEFRDLTSGRRSNVPTNGLRPTSRAAVAPDDKWLLVAAEAGTGRDLMIVENFR